MPVCILGMHRSGTSMVARLLNLCGLYLGPEQDMMPAIEGDNSEGFWEHMRFVEINDKLLAMQNADPYRPPQYDPQWMQKLDLTQVTDDANTVIAAMNTEPVWGWKDPRTTITFDFWHSLIPDLKVIFCLRHPTEVAQSLARRHSREVNGHSFRLWFDYNRMIFHIRGQNNILLTHYDAYFNDPTAELRRLVDFIELPVSDEQIHSTVESVSLRNRHNKVIDADFSGMPDYIPRLYDLLCTFAGPNYLNVRHTA